MTSATHHEIEELHWTLGLLQTLEVGLVVVDRKGVVTLWNGFMENHSGVEARSVVGQPLFSLFPQLPASWLQHKLDSVFLLGQADYISWEQRPYLFRFKSNRPVTGHSAFMYQNITLTPLTSPTGEVDHIGMLIYDVTDNASSQLALQDANQTLQALSREDRLTGLYNRGYWEECLEQEFERYNRTQLASTLVMLDIDHFKSINDRYGHQAGDEVIRQVASALQMVARKTDRVGRYGGEEFGVILAGTSGVRAQVFAERVRMNIEDLQVVYGGEPIRFTISLGVAEINLEMDSYQEWLECADQALYQSKQNGRNQVTLHGESEA